MRFRYDDGAKAVTWAREHWHVAGFVAASLVVVGAALAYFGVLSERAATAAVMGYLVYVAITTWNSTHDRRHTRPPGADGASSDDRDS